MAINEADINIFLSGGSSNTDQNLSTGGIISNTSIDSMQYVLVNSTNLINGMEISDAFGVEENVDLTITWNDSLKEISLTQGLNSVSEIISGDIKKAFFLASEVYVVLDIDYATIGTITSTSDVHFSYISNTIFDNVLPIEATEGDEEYRTLYIKNESLLDDSLNTKIYIENQTVGDDQIFINIGTLNQTPNDTGDTKIDPSGTWFLANNISNALLINTLSPNDFIPVFIRRSVPAGVLDYVQNNDFQLTIIAD